MANLRDAALLHQEVLDAEGARPATRTQYLFYERLFIDFLETRGRPNTLDALTPALVRACLLWYRQQPAATRTRNGEVAAQRFLDVMKRWSKVLYREQLLPSDPLRDMARVRVDKLHREPFTEEEVSALWGACRQTQNPERDEALFLLLLRTGMRIGEACSLTLDRVDLPQRRVIVSGKSRRERLVPIGVLDRRDGGRTVRALSVYLARRRVTSRAGGAVFLARDGYPLTPKGGHDVLERLGALAVVADAYPHRLRHTFCTWYLMEYPGDAIGLRRIVGHLSEEVLADYVHFSEATLAQRSSRASPVEGMLDRARLRRV